MIQNKELSQFQPAFNKDKEVFPLVAKLVHGESSEMLNLSLGQLTMLKKNPYMYNKYQRWVESCKAVQRQMVTLRRPSTIIPFVEMSTPQQIFFMEDISRRETTIYHSLEVPNNVAPPNLMTTISPVHQPS